MQEKRIRFVKRLSSVTLFPKVGDVLEIKINGSNTLLKVVNKTKCEDCYLYGKSENKHDPDSRKCFNFLGNRDGLWINCGGSYRSDKTSIMLIKI